MNRLNGQRVYLVGAMDRVKDRGVEWREYITPFLTNLGVTVFNPTCKPCKIGVEDETTHILKKELKSQGKYDELASIMKNIRSVDLRMVDISDFIIVNLDLSVHPCGTYEEIFCANRQKKPILVHVEQGKSQAPDWLFGTIPHNMIFSDWEELKRYLESVNSSPAFNNQNRWYFFDI